MSREFCVARVVLARQDQEVLRSSVALFKQLESYVKKKGILPSYNGFPAVFAVWDRDVWTPKIRFVSDEGRANLIVVFKTGRVSYAADKGRKDLIVLGVGSAHSIVTFLEKNKTHRRA